MPNILIPILILMIPIIILCYVVFYLAAVNRDLKKDLKDALAPKPKSTKPEPTKMELPKPELPKPELRPLQTGKQLSFYDVPEGYGIDDKGLPYKLNRVNGFGWGKEFNVFVVSGDKCFHKSKCKLIEGQHKQVQHRYIALKTHQPCPVCKPTAVVDDWFLQL